MAADQIPAGVELIWSEELRFAATAGSNAIVVDGNGTGGPSPTQLLTIALTGCMAADIVAILQKGRHPLQGLRASVTGQRAEEFPRRFLSFNLHFHLRGAVPRDAVDRAIALSRDKYCSVWHSLRQDIQLTNTFDILP
jgi:putative redox protein